MSEIDFQSLLDKHDKSDMSRFTRNFVDDLEAAMSAEINRSGYGLERSCLSRDGWLWRRRYVPFSPSG